MLNVVSQPFGNPIALHAQLLELRAVGVPARVVTGFSGGAWNDYGGYVVVRQGDEESTVPVGDPDAEPLRGIFMAGVAICVGSIAVMLLARLLANMGAAGSIPPTTGTIWDRHRRERRPRFSPRVS